MPLFIQWFSYHGFKVRSKNTKAANAVKNIVEGYK